MVTGFHVIQKRNGDVRVYTVGTMKAAQSVVYRAMLLGMGNIPNVLQQRFILDDIDADNFDSAMFGWHRVTGDTFIISPFTMSDTLEKDMADDVVSMSQELRAKWKAKAKEPDPRFKCPCCGKVTIVEGRGYYEICPVCHWEDDGIDAAEEYSEVNRATLAEGREAYKTALN